MCAMSPRLLRPLASGFNPKSISGLSLWLDAADTSTITVSTGVSVWADKSGNGRDAAQAVGGKQPAYSSTINGKNVVTFQGTDDTMQIGANAAFNATSQTIIVVARQNANANQALWYKADSNSAVGVIMRYRAASVFWLYQQNDVNAETLSNNASTNSNVNVFATVVEPANQSGFVNGTPVSTANVATAYDNNSGPWLGSRRDVGEYLQGDIAEVLHWNRALTAAEREKVQQYLGRKWGITVASVISVSNPEAQDWISKTYVNGGTVSASTASAVNTFCNAIDAAGIRDRFFRLNLFCGTGLNAALVPLYRGPSRTGTQYGNTTDTNVGPFVSGDYVETGASGGLTGNGTSKALRHGVTWNLLPDINSIHLSAYARSAVNSGSMLGAYWFHSTTAAERTSWEVFDNSVSLGSTATIATPAGGLPSLITASRVGATSAFTYRNATASAEAVVGTTVARAIESTVFARNLVVGAPPTNNSYGETLHYSGRLGGYSLGAGMTGTQVASYNTAMQAFQAALARNA